MASDNIVVVQDNRTRVISSPYEAPAGVALPDLLDTSIVTPLDGEILIYNTALSKWINGDIPADAAIAGLTATANFNLITSQRVLLDTWSLYTIPDGNWNSIVWIAEVELFIMMNVSAAVGVKGIHTSPDGYNWTFRASANVDGAGMPYWSALISKIVICTASPFALTSTDGLTWGTITTLSGSQEMTEGTPGMIQVGIFSGASTRHVAFSSDGITWVRNEFLSAMGDTRDVIWSPLHNKFFVLNFNGAVFSSADGTNFVQVGATGNSGALKLIWIATLSIIVVIADLAVSTSSDGGATWTTTTLPSNGGWLHWESVVWSEELGMIVIAAGTQIGQVSTQYQNLMSSTDGFIWNFISVPAEGAINYSIAWSGKLGRFVCTGGSYGVGGPYQALINT